MNRIDDKWIERFMSAFNNKSRSIPKNKKMSICTQEKLINRYFSVLKNRYFKMKIRGVIYYGMFISIPYTLTSTNNTKFRYINTGIKLHLFHSMMEIDLKFLNEKGQLFVLKRLSLQEISEIEYSEITPEEYLFIVNLFR